MHSPSRGVPVVLALLCSLPLRAQVQDGRAAGARVAAASRAQRSPRPKLAETYGTEDTVFVGIDAMDMAPIQSGYNYVIGENFTRYSENSSGTVFGAALHLPAGAQLVYLELDFYDGTNSNSALLELAVCDYLGADCIAPTVPGGCPDSPAYILCSGVEPALGFSEAHLDATSLNIFGDPYRQRLLISAGGMLAGGTAAIGQVIYGYKLRVSPSPATASFLDVPTSHPFFQFIEALVASGITAGCGGGKYCPDQPLTRGQMAVFLAKALGLHFQ